MKVKFVAHLFSKAINCTSLVRLAKFSDQKASRGILCRVASHTQISVRSHDVEF